MSGASSLRLCPIQYLYSDFVASICESADHMISVCSSLTWHSLHEITCPAWVWIPDRIRVDSNFRFPAIASRQELDYHSLESNARKKWRNLKIIRQIGYFAAVSPEFPLQQCTDKLMIILISCLHFHLLRQYTNTQKQNSSQRSSQGYYYIEALTWWGSEFVALNYLTVIYEEKYSFFDYKSYKSAILKEINKY